MDSEDVFFFFCSADKNRCVRLDRGIDQQPL